MTDTHRVLGSTVHVVMRLNSATQQLIEQRLTAHGLAPVFVEPEAFLGRLAEIEILLIGRPPRIDWSPARRLRVLHVAGSGIDPLFPAQGLRDDVWVTSSRGAHADAVRDHVLLLVLALTRDLPRALAQQKQRQWLSYSAPAVTGQRWCVVGFGEVGRRVAKAAQALGVQVTGVARTARGFVAGCDVVPVTELQRSVSQADVLILCLPYTRHTRGLVDEALLSRLPPQALIVNVSRGGILDEHAIERRLRADQIKGAALDVFEDEPLPATSSLWDCPRLIITPHCAGFTPDYMAPVVEILACAIERVRRGEVPLTLVSRDVEY